MGILNSCVAGKARYYLATGLWTKNQAEIKLERRFRNKLSETGFHYRAAALERLYLLATTPATDPLPKRIWEAAWELDQRHGIQTLVSRTRAVVESYHSISMTAESGLLSMHTKDGSVILASAENRRKLVNKTQTEASITRLRAKAIHSVY